MVPSPRSNRWLWPLAAAAALIGSPAAAAAQPTGTVTGTVTDATTGRPLAQAQVSIPSSNQGTLTTEAGRYVILNVPAGEREVRVDLIGYSSVSATIDVSAGGTVTRSFQLSATAISLDELVITATGQQRAREVANAVGQLNAVEQLENAPAVSLMTMLQAQVPSISIQQTTGAVGAASTFNIRGHTSLGLDNTPIVYIDGARIDNSNSIGAGAGGQDYSRLNDLSPENIASIEVVKGPAAATLYGTEASAGVVRITTRRGLSGAPQWNVWMEQGATWENVDWWQMAWNPTMPFIGLEGLTGVAPAADTTYVFSTLENDPLIAEPWRTGHQQAYGASVRGGSDVFTYFVSADFRDLEGVLPSDRLERLNARANFDATINEDLHVSISNGFVNTTAQLPENDNSLFSIIGNSLGVSWFGNLIQPDPTTGGEPIETCLVAFEYARATGDDLQDVTDAFCASPLFQGEGSNEAILDIIHLDETRRYTGSATATWTPLDFLSTRATVGVDQVATRIRTIVPVDPNRIFGSISDGLIDKTDLQTLALTLEASAAAAFDLTPDIQSITTVGFQFNEEEFDLASVTGRQFPAGSPAVNNSVETEASDAFGQEKTLGIFVQEQLSWRDQLFVTPAVRFDDNSAFGQDLGIQAYPRVGVSWVASEQAGFPEIFDQFRFRAAWGESGKQPGPNDALALLSVGPVAFRQTDILGFTPNRPGNPELKPETGTEIELGFDASLLGNRLGVEFTWFDKRTEDAIIARPDALSLGFPGNRFVNIGEIKNSGVELVVDADVIRGDDYSLQLGGTMAWLDNEVTDLPEPIVFGAQRHQEGLPFAAYYDNPVTIGSDGEVVIGDRAFLGQPTPKREGSLSGTLSLLDWVTVHALFDYKGGHKLFDGTESLNCALLSCPGIFEEGPDGEDTDEARRKFEAILVGTEDPFVYDADFVKLRTVSLSIHLPDELVSGIGATGARLTFSGDNLVTWTDFPGTDPEASFQGSNQVIRQEFIGMPQMPRFTTRLSLTF